MRIRQLDTIRLDSLPNLLFVQVHTDEGLVGLGETYFGPRTIEAYVHETVAPMLLGTAPEFANGRFRSLAGRVGSSSTGAETRGNAAVDIALWDLMGQASGVPIARLLGQSPRSDIPVYNTCAGPSYLRDRSEVASSNWGISGRPESDAYEDLDSFLHRADELAYSLLEQDIGGMKIWPFDPVAEASNGQYISSREITDCLGPIEKVRTAVGDRIDVMIELHGLWNLPMAQRIAEALEPYAPRWIEDPLRPHDFAALGALARSTVIPVAAGETLGGIEPHERMVDASSLKTVIVDLGWVGGISEAWVVATYAGARGIEMAFHDCTGPVVLMASTHLALAAPTSKVQEIVRAFYYGWYQDLVTDLPPIAQGRIRVTDAPGLGTALQPDLVRRPGVSVRSSRQGR